MMPKFIPGLKLSELYYNQVVAPILLARFPKLEYSAGLIGSGSEVLGYDTELSRDHNWGLRLFIFLSETDLKLYKLKIDRELRRTLPSSFLSYPTSFGEPDRIGVRLPDSKATGDINHYIVFHTIRSFFESNLGIDPLKPIKGSAWLTIPQQRLLEVTSGKIFRDDLGVKKIIQKFQYYPRDIWLYMMASQWSKISQEEAFVARTSEVEDEIGSRIIASRITKELMELCFLMERKYIPYSKWFGKAFSQLGIAEELKPILSMVLKARSISEREKRLSEVYRTVVEKHNSLGITKRSISSSVSKFHNRPYLVIHGDKFAEEIRKGIKDKRIRELALLGSIDQFTENTDLLGRQDQLERIRALYKV
jgi:hypothetical protein